MNKAHTGKKIILAIAVLMLLTIAITLIVLLDIEGRRVPGEKQTGGSIVYYYSEADASTHFYVNDVLLDSSVSGVLDAYITVDGTVAVFRAGTGLYRVDSEGVLMIHPAGVSRAVLSLDNRYILYSTATSVHLYDHETGELTKDIFKGDSILSLIISPDSSVFAASVLDSDGNCAAYAYHDGSVTLLNNGKYVIGVADDLKSAYYFGYEDGKLESTLYYQEANRRGDTMTALASEVSPILEFNRDLSEVTFDINGKTHYSVNGSAPKKLLDASAYTTAGQCTASMGGADCSVFLRDCESLFGSLFYTYYEAVDESNRSFTAYDLYFVSNSHSAQAVAKGISQFSIGSDRRTVLCLADDSLYRISARDPEHPELLSDSVFSFAASKDLSDIYYISTTAALFYLESSQNAIPLAGNASYASVTKDDVCLFITDYQEKGVLNYAVRDEVGRIADDVYFIESFAGLSVYYTNAYETEGVFDLFVSSDSRSFELGLDQVALSKRRD